MRKTSPDAFQKDNRPIPLPGNGYPCLECDGTVEARLLRRVTLPHRTGPVGLENVMVGVCNCCGRHYYDAELLHAADAKAEKRQ